MFEDSKLKIERANKHIRDLNTALNKLLAPDFYLVRENTNSKTRQKFIEYGFAKPLPFEDVALISGMPSTILSAHWTILGSTVLKD